MWKKVSIRLESAVEGSLLTAESREGFPEEVAFPGTELEEGRESEPPGDSQSLPGRGERKLMPRS